MGRPVAEFHRDQTLALPSVGAASGDPSIGMRRTTASAPDMQNPPDLAASSSTMLLKPIQPAGRALRRFVLRGAAYDRLAEAWVCGPSLGLPLDRSWQADRAL